MDRLGACRGLFRSSLKLLSFGVSKGTPQETQKRDPICRGVPQAEQGMRALASDRLGSGSESWSITLASTISGSCKERLFIRAKAIGLEIGITTRPSPYDAWGLALFSGKTGAGEIPNAKNTLKECEAMPQSTDGSRNPGKFGPWTIVQSQEVYRDAWMTVRQDNVFRPDGQPGTYSTVSIKPGVCVIPVDENGICYLTKEFHYAVGRETVEGISGGIEEGETAEFAATRELEEEVGIVAGRLVPLGTVDPLTAAVLSPTKLFLASDLRFTQTNMDSTECIERVEMPFHEVVRMAIESEITHAPSCVAILKANLHLQQQQLAQPRSAGDLKPDRRTGG